MTPSFTSEMRLVEHFVGHLGTHDSPWGQQVSSNTEFYYQRGRTDVVSLTGGGDVVAFEAKLDRWRDALHQAYRNTCFAHFSYVLLPEHTAERAACFLGEFERRRVGLCSFGPAGIRVIYEAVRCEPLQPWLSAAAEAHAVASA